MSCHCSDTAHGSIGDPIDSKYAQLGLVTSPDAAASTKCKGCSSAGKSVLKRKAVKFVEDLERDSRPTSMDTQSDRKSSTSSQESQDHSNGPMDRMTLQPSQKTRSIPPFLQPPKSLPPFPAGVTERTLGSSSLTFVPSQSTPWSADPTYFSQPCVLKGTRIIGGLVRTKANSSSTGSSTPPDKTSQSLESQLSSLIGQTLSRRDMIQSQLDSLRSLQRSWESTTCFAQLVKATDESDQDVSSQHQGSQQSSTSGIAQSVSLTPTTAQPMP